MSDRIGLAIDQATQDVYLDNAGNLVMVRNAEAVGQHVRQRLMTFEGEWFLDTTVGMTWLTEVMGRQYDPALAEALVKAHIMATDGVISIDTFSVSFAKVQRNLIVSSVYISTDYDEVVRI